MRALSDLPTVFPQALSTLLATVCPLRSVKHPRIIRLFYIHKKRRNRCHESEKLMSHVGLFHSFSSKEPQEQSEKQKESYQFRLFFFFGLILRFFVVFFVCTCLFLFLLLGSRRHVEIYGVWGSRRLLGFPPQSFISVPCQVEPSWTFPLSTWGEKFFRELYNEITQKSFSKIFFLKWWKYGFRWKGFYNPTLL